MEGVREKSRGKGEENKGAFVGAEARRADLFWFIELESDNGKNVEAAIKHTVMASTERRHLSSLFCKHGYIIISVMFGGIISVIFLCISASGFCITAVLQECSDQVPNRPTGARRPNKLPASLWGSNQKAARVTGCVEATEQRTKLR